MRAPRPHSFTPHRLYRSPSAATLLSLSTLLLFSLQTNAALINTTYDDSTASFKWLGHWDAIGPTSPCIPPCNLPPVDVSQLQGQTWHAGIFAVNDLSTTAGTFTFIGSAVYIYGIDQGSIQAEIQFTLGDTVTTHRYTGSEPLVYHSLFFFMTGLAADQLHQEGFFDYAVVTSEGDAGTSSARSSIAPSKATSISTESSLTSSASSQTSERPTPGSTEMPDSVTAAGESSSISASATVSSRNPSATRTLALGVIIGPILGAAFLGILVGIAWFFRRRRRNFLLSRARVVPDGDSEWETGEMPPRDPRLGRHPIFVEQSLPEPKETTQNPNDSNESLFSLTPTSAAMASSAYEGTATQTPVASLYSSSEERERLVQVEARLLELERHVMVPPPY
ncbi:hypothetical protein C8F01DRAFT_1250224 [Mycena amicta]|nr:hypothetical protein C8F01DRAFT_1250224 [Mycena amicta]